MPSQIYHCFVCQHKSIIVLTHILQMIPNRKKKQTNEEIKTPSACENNLVCLNAINHNIMFKPIFPPTHYPAVTKPFLFASPSKSKF